MTDVAAAVPVHRPAVPETRVRRFGRADYEPTWRAMREFTTARVAGTADEVWLTEHPPVYTLGVAGRAEHLPRAPNGIPVVKVDRGGQITYHGPGQRVVYLMLDLNRRTPDVRRYVATLEEWIIGTLAAFGVSGERREDRIGVWVRRPDKGEGFEDKIAAIGIRLKRWVSLHGIALNVEPDLTHYSGILACGVSDVRYGVTSLRDLGVTASMAEVDAALRKEFEPLFGATQDALPFPFD
jgi:lipoyl(octanoyl) transferase